MILDLIYKICEKMSFYLNVLIVSGNTEKINETMEEYSSYCKELEEILKKEVYIEYKDFSLVVHGNIMIVIIEDFDFLIEICYKIKNENNFDFISIKPSIVLLNEINYIDKLNDFIVAFSFFLKKDFSNVNNNKLRVLVNSDVFSCDETLVKNIVFNDKETQIRNLLLNGNKTSEICNILNLEFSEVDKIEKEIKVKVFMN